MRLIASFLILCLGSMIIPAGALDTSGAASYSFDIPRGMIGDDYILGPGDELEAHLIVGQNAMALDYSFTVNQEGKIFFPSIGEMSLSGISLSQARGKMISNIRQKYSESIKLSLMVSAPKILNVFLTGQLDRPGLFKVYDSARIGDLLKSAGVAKSGSDLSGYIYLKRRNSQGELVETRLSLLDIYSNNDKDNLKLQNGDILAIPSIKSYVYVYGEVARSGTFGYVPGQNLSDYINIAGGPTARASLGSVTVTRLEDGRPKVYRIDLSEIMLRGIKKNDIEIQAGDVVQVPGNFFYFSDFASFANTILLALTLYNTVRR